MIAMLLRHAANDSIGVFLAGRSSGIHLNEEGRRQAEALVPRLAGVPLKAVYASPLERARETAAPLARTRGLEVRILEEVTEIDYGRWTGLELSAVRSDPAWGWHLTARSRARAPGGESLLDVQLRMVRAIEGLATVHSGERIVIVSHRDPIRAALSYYAGIPLDLSSRLEIAPASISVINLTNAVPGIDCTNQTV